MNADLAFAMLCRFARRANYTILALLFVCLAFCAEQIILAFSSGRVSEIVRSQQDIHQCARIGDPVTHAECILATRREATQKGNN